MDAPRSEESSGLTQERFEHIKNSWLGSKDLRSLAIAGNDSYRQVAELIAEVERQWANCVSRESTEA